MQDLFWIEFGEAVDEFAAESLQKKSQMMMEHAGITREVNLLFCSVQTIQSLNQTYRSMDKPTDILSFGYSGEDEPLGDLAICMEIAQQQADRYGFDLEDELLRLIAHGLMHLQGYDHESAEAEAEMLKNEQELLKVIGLSSLYP